MDLFSLIGIAAAGAVASFTVRSFDPRAGKNIAVAACAVILSGALAYFSGVVSGVRELAAMGNIPEETVLAAVKATGIAYLAKLTASLCSDLGETSLASASELVGKLMLLVLALPLVRRIAEMLIGLVNSGMG